MGPFLADSVPSRLRFVWLGGALAAAITVFVATRPIPPEPPRHRPSIHKIGRCAEQIKIHVAPTPSSSAR